MNSDISSKAPVITIDGPTGSGKGTLCQLLAKQLGWHLLDSGAIYRLLALAVLNAKVSADDEPAITNIANNLNISFKTLDDSSVTHCFLEGNDVTHEIRDEQCGNMASVISKFSMVRGALLARQRAFQQPPGLVTDGRDMGTVVFPDANLKIFLDASCEQRAERRYNQLIGKEINVSLAQILTDLRQRDERDRNRTVAPLKPAEDALILDTSDMGIEAVLQWVLEQVAERRLS